MPRFIETIIISLQLVYLYMMSLFSYFIFCIEFWVCFIINNHTRDGKEEEV
jgi:hypothetical protein